MALFPEKILLIFQVFLSCVYVFVMEVEIFGFFISVKCVIGEI